MFAIGIEYLTGYVTATDPWDRSRPEWPPHPGRVFMAMTAAHFETKPDSDSDPILREWKAEREALNWLENLPVPSIRASDPVARNTVEVYVPPNDMGPTKLTAIPAFRNNRQPRTFPKAHLIQPEAYLIWSEATSLNEHAQAIQRLCEKVIRIGHSSSLVRMWILTDSTEIPTPNLIPYNRSNPAQIKYRLRIATQGTLQYLQDQFNGESIELFFDLSETIRTSKGKKRKEAQANFEKAFGVPWKQSLPPPPSLRPILNLTQEYVEASPDTMTPVETSCFDPNLIILTKQEGPVLGLESSWQLIAALRGAIEKHCNPTPEWVSGHQPDGPPSQNTHLALFPLAYVGSEYADGHIMGIAMACPRDIPLRERGQTLRNLLYNPNGAPSEIKLTLGKLGVWTLRLEERPTPPLSLQPETITAGASGSTTWASVTPIVLDRHPKTDYAKDRTGWIEEVSEIIATSCERIGLPRPIEIDIDKTSWHRGAPRAKPGPDGYPLMPQRPGGPNRRQIHAWLRFDRPVQGPVLLGSGRYHGYGLCKPWKK